MIDMTPHRLTALTTASALALLLVCLPNGTDAKAKAKAKAGKPVKAVKTETEPKADAEKKDEASDKKTAETESDEAAKESATDTDADSIFTEDEVKSDSAANPKAEETKVETAATKEEPGAEDKSSETAALSAEEEKTAPKEDTAREPAAEEANVEVVSSSTDKKFPVKEFDGANAVRRDRGFNILTARATRPMSLTLCIDHRPYVGLADGKAEDVFFDYLGLDNSKPDEDSQTGILKIGLGLRFGIIEGLDVGIYRLSDGWTVDFDTYELDVRYAFLKQEKFFVDVSARAGVSWFVRKDAPDAVGGYGEIFIDRVFLNSLLVGAGFQIHSNSHNDVPKIGDDESLSGAVLGVLEWRVIKQLALTAEIAAPVVGYGSAYGNTRRPSFPSFSMGLKVLTERHTFALLVSNTQFINADGIVAGSWRDFSDIIFGFQIFREFNFKK
jgi:hypothetical protein